MYELIHVHTYSLILFYNLMRRNLIMYKKKNIFAALDLYQSINL